MNLYTVCVELCEEPSNAEEVRRVLTEFQQAFNRAGVAVGLATRCLGVQHWRSGPPVATFIVQSNYDSTTPEDIDNHLFACLKHLDLLDYLRVLNRDEREQRNAG